MRVLLDGRILFDRAVEGRFPEPGEVVKLLESLV